MARKVPTVYWLHQRRSEVPAPRQQWLSVREAQIQATLRFPKRRNEWTLGRWTGKQAILAYLDRNAQAPHHLRPVRVEILAAPDGAPDAYEDGRALPLTLSLSHCGQDAVCALAGGQVALGCDLELIESRSPCFVRDFFTEEEQQLVAATSATDRDLVVTLMWSAKESCLKALRVGLRRDTRTVPVRVVVPLPFAPDAWSELEVGDDIGGGVFRGWWRRLGAHVVTVVTPREVGALEALVLPSTVA